jgi:uncharacterized protein YaiE (UPF0345 family)
MSTFLNKNGTAEFTADASDKVAVYSKDRVKIYTASIPETGKPYVFSLVVDNPPDTEYTTSAFSVSTRVRIESEATEAFYAVGTAPVITERRGIRGQGAPGALDVTGALTATMISSGIVTSAAAAVTATLPTGTVMDSSLQMEIGESFDWSVIKVGANTFTVAAAASGHTVVGTMAVATTTSGLFRTRKTAAATYITYRIG